MLQVSTYNKGSKATVFFDKDKTKVISFSNDHDKAQQDTMIHYIINDKLIPNYDNKP
jgi:hypothetical protein